MATALETTTSASPGVLMARAALARAREAIAEGVNPFTDSELSRILSPTGPWTSPAHTLQAAPPVPSAEIYLRTDSGTRSTGDLAPWVALLICGSENVVMMLLPARRIDQVKGSMYDRWIDLIQGPELTRCDVTNMQRKMLLTIAVSYCAFFRADHPCVDITDFDIFAGRLATSARALGPYDRANGELLNLVDYLEITLPEEIFLHSGVFSAEYDSEGDVDDVMGSVPDPELASLSDDGSIPSLETYYSGSDYE